MLTFERANELFRYDPISGKLFWKRPISNRTRAGDEAGTVVRQDGYKIIRLRGGENKYLYIGLLPYSYSESFPKKRR
jgi:hypothetical protein